MERPGPSERICSALVQKLPHGILIWQLDDPGDPRSLRLFAANPAASAFVGFDIEAAIGKLMRDVLPSVAEERVLAYAEVARSGQPRALGDVEYSDERVQRSVFSVTAIPLGERCVGVVFENVTAHKAGAEELLRANAFLDSIVENIPNMIFVKDAGDLRFERFNRAGEALVGVPRAALLGKNDHDFFPADQAEFFQRKDRDTLERGLVLDIPEEPIETPHGRRWLHTRKIPIHDAAGRPTHLLGISEDITERREAQQEITRAHGEIAAAYQELKRTQGQLVQSEKLASLGQLVAGIAHEVNNPLAFVSNNVAVLERDVGDIASLIHLHDEAKGTIALAEPALAARIHDLEERIDRTYTLENLGGLITRTRDGLRRIQQIVTDLRNFARLDESEQQEADMNTGVESTLGMLRGLAKTRGVELLVELAPLEPIACHPAKINQVIMNLIVNAIDATPDAGQLTVRTSAEPDGVAISVIDTGRGIAPEHRGKLFDPFFTTKPPGKGTGLGLSISYGIVKDHGGSIEVDSTVGVGSSFTVHLPRRGVDAR